MAVRGSESHPREPNVEKRKAAKPNPGLQRPAFIISQHVLKPYTTFKIGGPARYWAPVNSVQELTLALDFADAERLPAFVLGGGSNVLISDRGLEAMVLHPAMKGISILCENPETVWVRAEAGETWDDLVAWTVDRGLWGIENLSHIPGQAGAALVQNIGAYGQQISDVLEKAEVAELRRNEPKSSNEGTAPSQPGDVRTLSKEDCGMGYRRSIFNTTHKGFYFILNITLRLSRLGRPNLSYPGLRASFGNSEPSLSQVRNAIISIRDGKFPFPREEKGGNAGSFFKNLALTGEEVEQLESRIQRDFTAGEVDRLRDLRTRFSAVSSTAQPCGKEGGEANGAPGIVPASERIKIPTAFMIEICGLKGCSVGGAMVNETQPLVLLNRGGATANDVMRLAQKVRQTVFSRTGMRVPVEPELVGFTPEELEGYLALT